jgi:hypothetical protein
VNGFVGVRDALQGGESFEQSQHKTGAVRCVAFAIMMLILLLMANGFGQEPLLDQEGASGSSSQTDASKK